MCKPRDHTDITQEVARGLSDIAGQLASLKGEAHSWMRDSNYDTLKLRIEAAHYRLPRLLLWRSGGGYG